jgi:hypothetical protein
MTDHWQTGPAVPVSAPEDYPPPTPGRPVATWALRTPSGEPVGTLTFNEGGVGWAFASGVSLDAQEHGAEVQGYLRGHRAEGVALADALAGIRAAYEGDMDEEGSQK